MGTAAKYGPKAASWTESQYADPAWYLGHRAELVRRLGPPLAAGDTVLDLACGDAGLAEPLLPCGIRYHGVDLSAEMVEAAQARLQSRGVVEHGDLNVFRPPQAVAAVTCFRAIYYASDRPAFFRQVASFAAKKLVFDVNPRQFEVAEIVGELRAAGFDDVLLRPFFAPQTLALPRPLARTLVVLERIGPLARLLVRRRFTYLCVASRANGEARLPSDGQRG